MFTDKLDEMLGIKEPEKEPESERVETDCNQVQTQVPENEFEPETVSDPDDVPSEADPFTVMVDSLLASEGIDGKLEKRRKYDPTRGDVNSHDWVSQRETLFSDESYKFRCKRCLKWVTVGREQTINEAAAEQEVNSDCASQVVQGIQES